MAEPSIAPMPWDPLWLAQLSHDLRNELVPLRMATDLLRRGRLDADSERKMIATIDRQTERLIQMLDDVAEYGRALSALAPAVAGMVELALMVDCALGQVDTKLRAAGHRLQVTLPAELVEVRGDATLLSRLLARLLDNAVRFTPPGGDIGLRASRQTTCILIEVADSGCGIAPEQRQKIFGLPLGQGDADGLGLSLALARHCAQECGGDLQVTQDEQLGGALFLLTLPMA